MSELAFVTNIYRKILLREPDAGGVQYWSNQILLGGISRDTVTAVFLNGDEFQHVVAPVIRLYENLLGRAPDAAGLEAWVSALRTGKANLWDITEGFLKSAEATSIGIGPSVDNTAFVKAMYRTMGRTDAQIEADPNGVASWVNALNAGKTNRADIAQQITESPENLVSSAGFVTGYAALRSVGIDSPSTAQANAFVATASSIEILTAAKTVTDSNTLPTGPATKPVEGGVAGQTFTLTAGADKVAGTIGNDTINALTIKADGSTGSTFTAFDVIDGGAGNDTLNIYTTGALNTAFPDNASVKNVETVKIYNAAAAGAFADASKYEGVYALWQIGTAAADVTKLAGNTVAGFKDVEATVGLDVDVTAADAATSAMIVLDGLKGAATTGGGETENRADIDVAGAALTSVEVSGSLAQKTTTAGAAAASLALNVTLAKDAQAGNVKTGVNTVLTIENDVASTKNLTKVDASASTGDITYTGADADVATIKTGSGNDTVTIRTATVKDDAATTADETVSAVLEAGEGKDNITIDTTGTGTTTVNAGGGDDKVTLTTDGSGKLTVNLGSGNDTFTGTGPIAGTDAIDGGEGVDTLLLNVVGSANIGAFSNFEKFDAAGLGKTLDVGILAAKNTVTEFVASADVGANAVLTNLGADVGYRVIGDVGATNALTLTQKTAGALTITVDVDEAKANSAAETNDAAAVATNATSLKAVFDSAYADKLADYANSTQLTLTGTKATSLEVVSGGSETTNTLTYVYGKGTTSPDADGLLTSVKVSGEKKLTLSFSDGTNDIESNIATVDASAMAGALVFNMSDLKAQSAANAFDGGVVKLGSGDDIITGVNGGVLSGIEKGTVENAAKQENFDIIKVVGAGQAADAAETATETIKDGLYTFNGTGAATLADALLAVDTKLTVANAAVVFEYVGDSYVFVNNDTTGDTVLKLVGVTGLNGLDTVAAGDLYVF